MTDRYLLGLDAGGSGVRALLVSPDTGATHVARRPWRFSVEPGSGGWGLDFDCRAAWAETCTAVREVLASAGVESHAVLAVAATGMRHGMVLLDREGRELWAVPNRDARAAAEATELAAMHGGELALRTGQWPAPISAVARLRWLKSAAPRVLDCASALLSVSDWLTFRLSGAALAEVTQANATLLLRLDSGEWDHDLAARIGLPATILPRLTRAGALAGTLTETAARDLGLAAGIPVGAGAADSQSAVLGAGALYPGTTAVVAGSTMPVFAVVERPLVDPAGRLWSSHHAIEGRWLIESNAGGAGQALEWLAGLLLPGERDAVGRLLAEAASAPAGAGGLLSTVGAELFDARQLGLPVGRLTMSPLLPSLQGQPRAHAVRAVVEGLAFAVRANIEQVERVAGKSSGPLRLTGGLARSGFWRQLLADVTGRPVAATLTPDAAALGAAICAGVSAGVFSSLPQAVERLARMRPEAEPVAPAVEHYAVAFERWMEQRAAHAAADDGAAELMLAGLPEPASEAAPAPRAPGFRPLVLVTAPIDDVSLGRLRAVAEVRYEPYAGSQRVLVDDDLVEALADVHVLVTEVDVVDARSLSRLPGLRAVFSCRANPVNVDVAACSAMGVPVMSAPGRNAAAVADLTVAFLLSLAREVQPAGRFLREAGAQAGDIARMGQAHDRFEGHELGGMTIGLVGLGRVAREVVARLRPFGARIVAADPFVSREAAEALGVELLPLDEVLRHAGAVSLHAELADGTRGLIDAGRLAQMRPGAFLVNTARAGLVDEAALAEALRSGHLAGAALDVFAEEPPAADHPLLALPNVIATPHIGGNTRQVAAHQGAMVVAAVERLVRGEPPETLLNPDAFAGFSWTGERRALTAAEVERLAAAPGPAVTDIEAAALAEELDGVSPKPVRHTGLLPGLRRRFGRGEAPKPASPARPAPTAASPPSTDPGAVVGAVMLPVIEEFLRRLPADPAVGRFSAGKAITVRYHLPDAGIMFYTSFTGGEASGAFGEPPAPPQLTLRMDAAVLDDVFMERITGMRAAMSGKMAFSGNTMRAMTLQRVQKDLNRLYREARTALGVPDGPIAPPREPLPASPERAFAAPAHADPADERHELVEGVRELFAAGLLTASGGNVSLRSVANPEHIWITPSALPKGGITAEMLVRTGLDGEPVAGGAFAPSSERLMHTAIYRHRPDVQAVVHGHGQKAIALGLSALPFLPISTEAAFIGELPRLSFTMPGTDELAEAAAGAMAGGHAVLLVNHGLLAAGTSLQRAIDITRVIEETAAAILDCYAVGREPPVLPPEIAAQLRDLGEMMA